MHILRSSKLELLSENFSVRTSDLEVLNGFSLLTFRRLSKTFFLNPKDRKEREANCPKLDLIANERRLCH